MVDLCKNCKNFETCIEEGTANDCIDNDYIGYTAKTITCENCFYEDFSKLSLVSPCWKCIRQPVSYRVDNYISKSSEREKYNE